METHEPILQKRSLINERLDALVPLKNGPYALLFEAARYSLLLPGKRLRPALCLSVLEDYDVPIDIGIDAACALELVHTYSLIHDDLPCMDDDTIRRGKPTLHTVYGEGHAVLTGDFLLTRAFEIIAYSPSLVSILATQAGGEGLIGGQVVDLLSEGKTIDWETLECMYLGKTAALFAASLEFGGVIAGLSEDERVPLKIAGKYFGLAFQIQDDLADGYSEESSSPLASLSSDQIKEKATSLTLFGTDKAAQLATTFLNRAIESLPNKLSSVKALFRACTQKP